MLTETEKLLAREVGTFELSEDSKMGIYLFLEEEDQQRQMLDFLRNNKGATEQEILRVLKRIICT